MTQQLPQALYDKALDEAEAKWRSDFPMFPKDWAGKNAEAQLRTLLVQALSLYQRGFLPQKKDITVEQSYRLGLVRLVMRPGVQRETAEKIVDHIINYTHPA